MDILSWIIIGALAGWVASLLVKTAHSQGLVTNVAVGVVGALIGGFIMRQLGEAGVTGFNLHSFLVALLGAIVLLAALRLIKR